jgi:predicted amidophosphoribosyltransferase
MPFVPAGLNSQKAPLKGLGIEQKLAEWGRVYQEGGVVLPRSVKVLTLVVIDDLYQSGATLWTYARYLKSQGAAHVFGLPCVKALRDSDSL